jgi:hypothetical protein
MDASQYADPKIKYEALVVSLRYCETAAEAQRLAATMAASVDDVDDGLFGSAMALVTRGKVPPSAGSAFLAELLKRLPEVERRKRATVISAIDDVLRRRRSTLPVLSTKVCLELKGVVQCGLNGD